MCHFKLDIQETRLVSTLNSSPISIGAVIQLWSCFLNFTRDGFLVYLKFEHSSQYTWLAYGDTTRTAQQVIRSHRQDISTNQN
jgi:hypothetical protein